MSLVAVPGSLVTAGAMRRGPILVGGSLLGTLGARVGVRNVVVVLPVIGLLLLLALVLIITGCGPPN